MSVCCCRLKNKGIKRIAFNSTSIEHNGDLTAARSSSGFLHQYCENTSDDQVELRIALRSISDGVNRKSLERRLVRICTCKFSAEGQQRNGSQNCDQKTLHR